MSHLVVRPGEFEGEKVWRVELGGGKHMASDGVKKQAVTTAKQIAENDGYSHVLIHDSDDWLNHVWWSEDFWQITVEYNDQRGKWELWEPGNDHFGATRKSEVVDYAKRIQEDYGYKRLKIRTKDGGVSWTRKHPHARRR